MTIRFMAKKHKQSPFASADQTGWLSTFCLKMDT